MADLLNIGLSALLAQQRALATTSNNIANASTEGYSRQRVELTQRSTERLGDSTVGTGVQLQTIRRLTDEILVDQVRINTGSAQRSGVFADLAQSLDDLLANSETGVTATLQSFVNSLQGLANNPSSDSVRQALLGAASSLVSRFTTADQRLAQIDNELRSRLTATTKEVNSLGASIADVNRQLALSGTTAPSDLVDKRDQLLQQLAGLVQVKTSVQNDGTVNVFIGSGQTLVVGTTAATLAIANGTADPAQAQIVLKGLGPDVEVTRFMTGGEIGGLLDFNREMLSPTRADLGRIAAALVATVNVTHRNGMDATGALGGDFFSMGGPQAFADSRNGGTGAVTLTIANFATLQPTNYQLSFDGATYTLTRTDNGAAVPLLGAGTAGSPFVADGLSMVITGVPAAGAQFLLKPVEGAAGTMRLLVTRSAAVAAAAPTRTSADLANTGTGAISAGQIINVTDPNLLVGATVQFINATTYSINGAGAFAYAPGANIDVNGTRIQITGTPATGDVFRIASNAGGTGDNRNALALIAGLGSSVFSGNASLQDAAATLVTRVGSQTKDTIAQHDVQQQVLDSQRQRLDSIRGVNLDEEAANMLQQQQMYQAAAKTLAIASTLFETVLAALGR